MGTEAGIIGQTGADKRMRVGIIALFMNRYMIPRFLNFSTINIWGP